MNRTYVLPVFGITVGISLLFLLLSYFGLTNFLVSGVDQLFFPLGGVFVSHTTAANDTSAISQLQAENQKLLLQLAKFKVIQDDNKALRDQFATTTMPSQTLLPAQVVGKGAAGVHFIPDEVVIDKGKNNQVSIGRVVVYKDGVVGLVSQSSNNFASVQLVSNPMSSFPAKTGDGVLGVIKGQGEGNMILDNVLLSETLHIGDVVQTSGNQTGSGAGYPPNLVVGKIISIDKNPSSLFQSARVAPLLSFEKMTTVFIQLP